MSYETVLPIWNALRDRFLDKAKALNNDDLELQFEGKTIGDLLYHTGEVEYMFAEWFFGKRKEDIVKPSLKHIDALVAFMEESNQFLKTAMEALPEKEWSNIKETPMGKSTPLEAVGRLMYHAGIHSGQITDIKKIAA